MWGKFISNKRKKERKRKKKKIREKEKKKEKSSKQVRMNSQVLVVQERVQKFESGPKYCVNRPFLFKVEFCIQK